MLWRSVSVGKTRQEAARETSREGWGGGHRVGMDEESRTYFNIWPRWLEDEFGECEDGDGGDAGRGRRASPALEGT